VERMTPREYQVATLVARGLTNKEIARRLGVTEGTVKIHVHNILRKLGAKNRYALGLLYGHATTGLSAEATKTRG
jgi:two-component system nitrate/nitrite response regulator NarL